MTYFDYMLGAIDVRGRKEENICAALHDILIADECEFIDQTRGDDVLYMRQDYIEMFPEEYEENDIHQEISVLELLVSLAIKIEDKVMSNPIYGNRTGKWFWTMLDNLELSPEFACDDMCKVDYEYVSQVCQRWLNGCFDRNGVGSPFPLRNAPEDVRHISMWRQAMLYFNENFEGKW